MVMNSRLIGREIKITHFATIAIAKTMIGTIYLDLSSNFNFNKWRKKDMVKLHKKLKMMGT